MTFQRMAAGLSALVLAGLTLFSCSPKLQLQALWQNQEQAFSLSPGDSQGYDRDTRLHYLLSNDRDNLYVVLWTDDPDAQRKMLWAGMELAIDTNGRKEGHGRIVFPESDAPILGMAGMGRPAGTDRGRAGQGQDPAARQEMLRRLVDGKTHMNLSGFKNHRNGRMAASGENGITVSLELDSAGVLTYRALIPLRTYYRELPESGPPDRPFSLLVTANGLEGLRPAGRSPGSPSGSGMPGRIPGRVPGGVMPGTRGPSSMPSRPAMSADREFLSKSQDFQALFYLSGPFRD